jgi:hypothetical protein
MRVSFSFSNRRYSNRYLVAYLQNARELCFEWGIGENDARTLAYEVAAAATPRREIPW